MTQANRKTWILGGAAVVILATALLAFLYLSFWAPPSRQDFADAKATAEKITTYSGSALLGDFVQKVNQQNGADLSWQELAEVAANEKKKVVEAMNARKKLAEKLQASPIVRDEQVKKAHDVYAAKEAEYRTYILGYADTYPAYKSSFTTCIKVFQINDQAGGVITKLAGLHRTAAKPCLEDLNVVAKSPITPLADYAKEFRRIINERQKVFDGIEKKTLDTDEAGDRITQLGADYTKNNPVSALQKFIKDSLFDGELDALIKLLDEKVKTTE